MEIITKMIPMQFIKCGDYEFPLNDVLEVLESLEDTDSCFKTLTVYNNELETWLIENKAAKKTTRGSIAKAGNYDFFKEIIEALVYKN
jgi:hypothetical protein